MELTDVIEWLQDIPGLKLEEDALYLLAASLYDLIREYEDEAQIWEDHRVGIEKIPLDLFRDDGYLCLKSQDGENWIRIESIEKVRHVSHLEIDLNSGDTLSVNLTSSTVTEAIDKVGKLINEDE
jgi:hypothetical protein